MRLGEFLVARNIITEEELFDGLKRQREQGGKLGEHLLAAGALTQSQLDDALSYFPQPPGAIGDTGLNPNLLLGHVLKLIHSLGLETTRELEDATALPGKVCADLTEAMRERELIQMKGSASLTGGDSAEIRYGLTGKGRDWALEALDSNQYVGPAPVPFDDWIAQIKRQSIMIDPINPASLTESLSDLVLQDGFIDELGPAVNSGRSILIYGPPGNGKTTIAEGVARAFKTVVFIPHAVEIEGQIIKVYDPTLHRRVDEEEQASGRSLVKRRSESLDTRWVPCFRPVVVAGGELSLDMLDFIYNDTAKFYEAPLHVKAINGVFLIDDFGRQQVEPTDLLNRWIIPLEKRVDYLTLATGQTLQVPFDELLIFSTNLVPDDLMDDAFLRRIPYKVEIGNPSRRMYEKIFGIIAKVKGVELPDDLIPFIYDVYYDKNGKPPANYQPGFIIDRVIDICRYHGVEPELRRDFVLYALRNLTSNADDATRLAGLSEEYRQRSGSAGNGAAATPSALNGEPPVGEGLGNGAAGDSLRPGQVA
ncbi:MAG: AAA family ATPase [Alphaproteobacteria bacterium]